MSTPNQQDLAAQVAALQAQLAVAQAQLAAAAAQAAAPAMPDTPGTPGAAGDERELRRQDKALLQKVSSAPDMTNLLGVLQVKKSSKTKIKKWLLKVCVELDKLSAAASRQVPSIARASNYLKVDELKRELFDTEKALSKTGNPLSRRERARIVSVLSHVGILVPDPGSAEDEARAATTEEETADEDDQEEAPTTETEAEEEMPDVERDQAPPTDDAPALVRRAYDIIMGNAGLRRMLRFDLAPFLLRVHNNVAQNLAASTQMPYALDYGDTIKMYGGGKTQARKTPLKLCAFIMCRMMGVATVVLTTNVSGRDDLFGKFLDLLDKIRVPTIPATIPIGANDAYFRYYRVKEREDGRETTKTVLRRVSASPPSAAPHETPLAEGVIAINDIGRTESARNWACVQLSQGACIVVNNAAPSIGPWSAVMPLALCSLLLCIHRLLNRPQFVSSVLARRESKESNRPSPRRLLAAPGTAHPVHAHNRRG